MLFPNKIVEYLNTCVHLKKTMYYMCDAIEHLEQIEILDSENIPNWFNRPNYSINVCGDVTLKDRINNTTTEWKSQNDKIRLSLYRGLLWYVKIYLFSNYTKHRENGHVCYKCSTGVIEAMKEVVKLNEMLYRFNQYVEAFNRQYD